MATETLTRTHVILPKELVESVDRLVGRRQRSRFFAEAAQEKLRRERRRELFLKFGGRLEDVDIPGWETSESASEWVRALRRESDQRPERIERHADHG